MLSRILPALRFSVLMIFLCGLAYPLAITALAQVLFPWQANGSLLYGADQKQAIGSELLGQTFIQARYFHPRPAVNSYDAANSGGANLGANSKKLVERIQTDIASYKTVSGMQNQIPVDAITASSSSLDPHISLANALLQVPTVAKARGMNSQDLENQVKESAEKSLLTESPYINVLTLNLRLDRLHLRHNP